MSTFFTGKGIIGFKTIIDYANRMENISETARHRLKLLTFWDKHGLSATIDALQAQFVDYHEDLLFTDLKAFNEKMAEYLY
ncbi:MAG: hypothetical protein ACWIPH_08285, partial [Ostreibacterium sp.]